MALKAAAAKPTLIPPLVYSVGPSWFGLACSAAIIGAMAPWLGAREPVELWIPLIGVTTFPEGSPLWMAGLALFFAFLSSVRSRIIIDEPARTITRWRCIAVLIPWSIKTRTFDEVRFVWMGVLEPPDAKILGALLGGDEEGSSSADPAPTPSGKIGVRVVFQDRDWYNVARGSEKQMIVVSEKLCQMMDTRRG